MQAVGLTSLSYLFMAFFSCSPPPKDGKSSKKAMCHCKYTAQENGPDKLLKQKKTASDGVGCPQRANSHSRWTLGSSSSQSWTGDPDLTRPLSGISCQGQRCVFVEAVRVRQQQSPRRLVGPLCLARRLGFTSPKTQAGNYRVLVFAFISF